MGWMGEMQHLIHVLNVVGADKDEEGSFLIYNGGIHSFLGLGEEVTINDESEYSIGGKKASVAGLMNSTSYGFRGVTVIS